MQDKDQHLLFEAYQLLSESFTDGPGEGRDIITVQNYAVIKAMLERLKSELRIEFNKFEYAPPASREPELIVNLQHPQTTLNEVKPQLRFWNGLKATGIGSPDNQEDRSSNWIIIEIVNEGLFWAKVDLTALVRKVHSMLEALVKEFPALAPPKEPSETGSSTPPWEPPNRGAGHSAL